MKKHDSEKDITKAQEWLRNCGSSIKVTGKYTIGMKTAILKFQKDNRLEQTGILDNKTWAKLKIKNSVIRKLCFWKK